MQKPAHIQPVQAQPGNKAVPEAGKGEPEAIFPTCPGCGADPLNLMRLRYDFPDGVMIEVVFCANRECRTALSAFFAGIDRKNAHR